MWSGPLQKGMTVRCLSLSGMGFETMEDWMANLGMSACTLCIL